MRLGAAGLALGKDNRGQKGGGASIEFVLAWPARPSAKNDARSSTDGGGGNGFRRCRFRWPSSFHLFFFFYFSAPTYTERAEGVDGLEMCVEILAGEERSGV